MRAPARRAARATARRRSSSSCSAIGFLQQRLQPPPRAHEPDAVRLLRRPDERGGLAVRQLGEVAQRERQPVGVRRAGRARPAPSRPPRARSPPRPGPRSPVSCRSAARAPSRSCRRSALSTLCASLTTIRSSHGLKAAPARKRWSERYAFTKPFCIASSASALQSGDRGRDAVRDTLVRPNQLRIRLVVAARAPARGTRARARAAASGRASSSERSEAIAALHTRRAGRKITL